MGERTDCKFAISWQRSDSEHDEKNIVVCSHSEEVTCDL